VTAADGTVSQIEAKTIVIATGSAVMPLPGVEIDEKQVVSSTGALELEKVPGKLVVVGGGVIGLELGSVWNRLGSQVTVVEFMDKILGPMDGDVSKQFQRMLKKQGMEFKLSSKVTGVARKGKGLAVTVEPAAGGDAETIDADIVLVAIGRRPYTEGLGLEEAGVALDERGRVKTDGHSRTNVDGIYAIGDVAGPPMLAHKAEHEGVICVEKIAGKDVHAMDKSMIPGCTYCNPQVASVGLTEPKAKEAGYKVKVGRFPFMGNGKAIALGEPEGLIKTIFDEKTGQLLGAHMVGAEVTELIQGFVVAMNLETTEEDLMHTVFPHPTLSEMMKESVLDAYGRVLNI